MEFRIFFGGHRVGQDHLGAQLDANRDLLESEGILLPTDAEMEAAVWPAIKTMRKNSADDTTLPTLIEKLTGGKSYRKVLVIRPSISGSPLHPIKDDIFYPRGSATVAHLLRLIGQDNVRLFGAVRNPASFLPSCYNVAYMNDPNLTLQAFSVIGDPFGLRWSEYLHRVQGPESEVPLTLWSYEDYPYIWRSVAQAFAGLPNKEDLIAADAPIDQGMSLKGLGLMQQYLQKHPVETASERHQIARKFEERFPPVIREVIPDLWPEDLVGALSDSYDDDLYYIERMDNVRMIKRVMWG